MQSNPQVTFLTPFKKHIQYYNISISLTTDTEMSKGLILISGVNGYIASVLAKHLLDAGFSVRGTVRKVPSAAPLIEGPLKPYAESGAFTVVEVPDISVDGAFDEAVKGVTAIAHLASPVSFYFTDPEPIIRTAVHGTQSILTSALSAGPQLKSFIYLSSIAAVLNATPPPYAFTERDWNNVAEAKVAELGKNTPGPTIYAASKTAAEKAFWKFKEEKRPSFTMTTLNPVFVTGPPLIAPKTPDAVGETILPIWTIFSGASYPSMPLAGLGHVVDVRDVASLVSSILNHPKETDGERYIASSAFSTPQSIADALRKAFPDAVRIIEGNPGQGYRPDHQVDGSESVQSVNSSKARKLLEGGAWIPYEKSIVDTAKSFVGLL